MLPKFWRKIRFRYCLIGSYCENCGNYYYPPRNLCPKCRRKGKIKEVQFNGYGRVLTWSVVHDAVESFWESKPYVVALIELDEGARIVAPLDCDPNKIEEGMRVKAVFKKFGEDGDEGIIHYGTKFVPV